MGEIQLMHYQREGEDQNVCGSPGVAIKESANPWIVNPSEITCPDCYKNVVVEATRELVIEAIPAALDKLIR